jgi:hypothetical protein
LSIDNPAVYSVNVDKRISQRYKIWLPVESENLADGVAISHDASLSGLLLVSRCEMTIGTEMDLRFRIPPDTGKEFQMRAKVVRCERNVSDAFSIWPFQIAVQFHHQIEEFGELLASCKNPLDDD